MSETRVIKIAVLVTADTRPKDLSRVLDVAFEDMDEVLQFTVEGYGWSEAAWLEKELSRYANYHQTSDVPF
jgi:hypothetical protein